jgi:predicted amidohydrolase YtcJ
MVVTQPSFIYYNGDRYLETVPAADLEHLYALASMIRSHLPVAASSDFPIADPNPLVGICAAVTRGTESGNRVLPEQRISVPDALRMHTLVAAMAAFEEGIKGSISPGKLADLVLLEENPLVVDPVRIKDIQVVMTILNGKIVWELPGS